MYACLALVSRACDRRKRPLSPAPSDTEQVPDGQIAPGAGIPVLIAAQSSTCVPLQRTCVAQERRSVRADAEVPFSLGLGAPTLPPETARYRSVGVPQNAGTGASVSVATGAAR
jgi:hypothetical protein